METKLYNNNVKLKFTHNGHRYQVDQGEGWKPVQGVTTILGKVVAKDGLINWAANLAVQAMVDGATPEEAKMAHTKKKQSGADVGSLVHATIEMLIGQMMKGQELVNIMPGFMKLVNTEFKDITEEQKVQATKAIEAFVQWTKERNVKFLESEIPVYSKKYNYCGTCDFIAEVDGRRYIGDWKTADPKKEWKQNKYTGKLRAYPEHFIQVAAYDQALTEMGHAPFDGHMIVYVTKEGKLHTFINKQIDENKKAWYGALDLSRRLQALDNY